MIKFDLYEDDDAGYTICKDTPRSGTSLMMEILLKDIKENLPKNHKEFVRMYLGEFTE